MTERRPDSFPYLHAARRRAIPYGVCLAYIEGLERKLGLDERKELADKLGLSARDCLEIEDAWRHEMLRREGVPAPVPQRPRAINCRSC